MHPKRKEKVIVVKQKLSPKKTFEAFSTTVLQEAVSLGSQASMTQTKSWTRVVQFNRDLACEGNILVATILLNDDDCQAVWQLPRQNLIVDVMFGQTFICFDFAFRIWIFSRHHHQDTHSKSVDIALASVLVLLVHIISQSFRGHKLQPNTKNIVVAQRNKQPNLSLLIVAKLAKTDQNIPMSGFMSNKATQTKVSNLDFAVVGIYENVFTLQIAVDHWGFPGV